MRLSVSETNDTILVTGGAGFIGQWLIRRLLQNQQSGVILYDNFFTGHRKTLPLEHPHFEVIEGDIRDRDTLCQTLKKHHPRLIYHLAAHHFIPYCNAHPDETLAVNVMGVQSILDACRTAPVEQLIFASTAAVYPIREGANSEDSPVDPIDIYGISKMFGETLVRRFAMDTGTKCTVGRFFNAYGAGETNPHVIPEIMTQLQQGDHITVGNLDPKRDYIYTDDMAAALELIGRENTSTYEVYNIGTGQEYAVRELISIIGTLLDRPLEVKQAQQRMRATERLHLVADITKIHQHLGWRPCVSLKEGLRHTLQAYGVL